MLEWRNIGMMESCRNSKHHYTIIPTFLYSITHLLEKILNAKSRKQNPDRR